MIYMEEFTVDTLNEQKYKMRCEHNKNIQQLKIINSIGKEFNTWKDRNEFAKESLIAMLEENDLLFPIYIEWGKIHVAIMKHYKPRIGQYCNEDLYNYPSPPPTPHLSLVYSEEERAELFRDQIGMAYNLGIKVLPIEAAIMEIPLDRWIKG